MKLRALFLRIVVRLQNAAIPPRQRLRQDEFVFRSEESKYPVIDAEGTALPPHGAPSERKRRGTMRHSV